VLGNYSIDLATTKLAGKIQNTGGHWVFKTFDAGTVVLPAGEHTLKVTTDVKGSEAMQLEGVKLTPIR
jgi:hypothetical protein